MKTFICAVLGFLALVGVAGAADMSFIAGGKTICKGTDHVLVELGTPATGDDPSYLPEDEETDGVQKWSFGLLSDKLTFRCYPHKGNDTDGKSFLMKGTTACGRDVASGLVVCNGVATPVKE